MAFATVTSVTSTFDSAASDALVANFPASGINSGDLIIAMEGQDGGGNHATITAGTRYTSFVDLLAGVSFGPHAAAVAYLIADGTENGGTLTFGFNSTPDTEECQAWLIHIEGWHGTTAPEYADIDHDDIQDPDPPSLNPSGWGTEDTLWIAGYFGDCTTARTISSWPYSDNQTSGHSGDNHSAFCTGEVNAASQDPGIFDTNASNHAMSFTIAVRPSAAASAWPRNPLGHPLMGAFGGPVG
jgi:hypothetical protein